MAPPNFQSLSNFIWSVADLLRGPYRPPQYIKVRAEESKNLESALCDSIDFLKEQRCVLITPAVTGKLAISA